MSNQHTDLLVTAPHQRGWGEIFRLRPLTVRPHVAVIITRAGRFVSVIPPGSKHTLSDLLDRPCELREVDMRERTLFLERAIPSRDPERCFQVRAQLAYRVIQPARVALEIADPLGELTTTALQAFQSHAELLGVEQADVLRDQAEEYLRSEAPFAQRASELGIAVRHASVLVSLEHRDRMFADHLLYQMHPRPFNAQFLVGQHDPAMAVFVELSCLYRVISRRGLVRTADELDRMLHSLFENALARLANIVPNYTLRELGALIADRLLADRMVRAEVGQLDIELSDLVLTIEPRTSGEQVSDEPPDWLQQAGERIVAVGTTPIEDVQSAVGPAANLGDGVGETASTSSIDAAWPAEFTPPEPRAAEFDAAAWLAELDSPEAAQHSEPDDEWILEGPVVCTFYEVVRRPGYRLFLPEDDAPITDRLDRLPAPAGTHPETREPASAHVPAIPAPSNPHVTQRLAQHDADQMLGARSPITSPLGEHGQQDSPLPADEERVSEVQPAAFEPMDTPGAQEPDSEQFAAQPDTSARQEDMDDDYLLEPVAQMQYELLPIAVPAGSVVQYNPHIERWIELLRSDGEATFQRWAQRLCEQPGDLPKLLRGLIREPAILEHADEAPYQHALTDELQGILTSLSSGQERLPARHTGYQAGDESSRNGKHF